MTEQRSPSLRLVWSEAPWDSAVCGFPVLQITTIEITGPEADEEMRRFEQERDRLGAGLVSCRLPHERLRESMLLEDRGFRFIEMLYQPEIDLDDAPTGEADGVIEVTRATEADLPELLAIAGTVFTNERFTLDFRLDPRISGLRYQNWVASSLNHAAQELYVLRDAAEVVALFVTEMLADGTCYWHLNAVAPQAQGRGYGRRAWESMLRRAVAQGARRVRTSVVAGNFRVLNLYARLGFRFSPPLMTFHWVRSKV